MIISLIDQTATVASNIELCRILMDESAFICEYLERGLIKKKVKYGCSRLNFDCIDSNQIRDELWKFEGVGSIEIPFDSKYYSMNKQDKISYICHLIEYGFKKYCNLSNTQVSPVLEILAELKDLNYFVDFYALKPCRRDEYMAKLYCIQDMDHSNFFVELYHKRKFINRIPFFQSYPDRLGYSYALGSFEWIDDNTVCLYSHPHYIDNSRETKILKVK